MVWLSSKDPNSYLPDFKFLRDILIARRNSFVLSHGGRWASWQRLLKRPRMEKNLLYWILRFFRWALSSGCNLGIISIANSATSECLFSNPSLSSQDK